MTRFLSLALPAALFFLAHPILFAQNAASGQAVMQAEAANLEQTELVFSPVAKLQYFVLEHRSPDQIAPSDAKLLEGRSHDVRSEAEFYGYDLSAESWSYEQSVCSMMPDYVMLRYLSKDASGADSIFTALVPRNGGRIWLVPVLNHGATRFKPAPIDPRNFQLFSRVVPGELALKNSGPDGKWLSLSVCYAEMTGALPQVPNQPSLNIHMIKAPPPTLHISVSGKEHEVRFVEPVSSTDYKLWEISYDAVGQITAVSDDQHSFGEPVVRTIPEPPTKVMPQAAAPPVKVIPASKLATPYPKAKAVPPPQ